MHKCFKCGNEFEGRFCPECGTEWKENKVCPQCGATLAGNAKFCNQCGYAFAEQEKPKEKKDNKFVLGMKKFGAWLKKHLKVVVPVTAAALVLIVICSLIPTFIVASVNGTYYRLTSDGEFVNEDFITLSTGKWTDGKTKGTYALKGGAITVKADIEKVSGTEDWGDLGDLVGDLEQEASTRKGEIKNGVIKFTDKSRTEIYCKKNHKHKYGKWETVTEPTCTAEGSQKHSCFCEHVEIGTIEPTGHNEFSEGKCVVCGTPQLKYTKARVVVKNYFGYHPDESIDCGYTVDGFNDGVAKKGDVHIWSEYEGLPVMRISDNAFKDCKEITSVEIPRNVLFIGRGAFENCTGLTSIDIPAIDPNLNITKGGATYDDGIMEYAFYGCTNLKSVSIGDGVRYISAFAFNRCKKLTDVKLPNAAVFMQYPFYDTNVGEWENGVYYVGNWAFGCQEDIGTVTLRPNTAGIADGAFVKKGVNKITIPKDIACVYYTAFIPRNLNIEDSEKYVQDITFEGTKAEFDYLIRIGEIRTYGFTGWKGCELVVHCSDGDWTKMSNT